MALICNESSWTNVLGKVSLDDRSSGKAERTSDVTNENETFPAREVSSDMSLLRHSEQQGENRTSSF